MPDCSHCGKNCACVGVCRCADTREQLGNKVDVPKEGGRYCEFLKGLREGRALELVPLDPAALEYVNTVLTGLPGVEDVVVSKQRNSVFAASKEKTPVDVVRAFAERDTMEVELSVTPNCHSEFALTGATCNSCTSNIARKLKKEPSSVSAWSFDLVKGAESTLRTYSEPWVSGPRLQVEVADKAAQAAEKFGVAMRTGDDKGTLETALMMKNAKQAADEGDAGNTDNVPEGVLEIEGVASAGVLPHNRNNSMLHVTLGHGCNVAEVRRAVAAALRKQNLLLEGEAAECEFCGPRCPCSGWDCDCEHEQEVLGKAVKVSGADPERYCEDLKAVTNGQYVEIVPASAEALERVHDLLKEMDGVTSVVLSKERESVFVGTERIPDVIQALREKEATALTLLPQRHDEFKLTGATCNSCTANIGRKFKKAKVLGAWTFNLEEERLDVYSYAGIPTSEVQVEVANRVLTAGEKFGVARKVKDGSHHESLQTSVVVEAGTGEREYPVWGTVAGVASGEVVPCANSSYEVVNIGMLDGASPAEVRRAVHEALLAKHITPAGPEVDWRGPAEQQRLETAPDFDPAEKPSEAAAVAVDVKALEEQRAYEFIVGGMRCVSCAKKIEDHLGDVEGVVRANVNAATSITRVVVRPGLDSETVARHIVGLGFTAELLQSAGSTGYVFEVVKPETTVATALKVVRAMEMVTSAEEEEEEDGTGKKRRIRVKVVDGVMAMEVEEEAREQGLDLLRDKTNRNEMLLSALKREDAIEESKWAFIESAIPTIPLMIMHMILESFAGVAPMRDVKLRKKLTLEPVVEFVLCTYVIVRCGGQFYRSAWGALRNGSANMAVLVVIGVSTAYLASIVMSIIAAVSDRKPELHYATAAALLCFMLLGQYLEAKAKAMTSEALVSLMELQPSEATVLRKDRKTGEVVDTVVVDTEDLVKGVVCRVAAGVRVPCDGHVVAGNGDVDEAMVTGEPMPVNKRPGDEVVGGTIVIEGAIDVEVDHCGDETMLSQILTIVLEAQNSKAPIQKYADMISSVFVPTIVIIAILVFVIWLSLGLANVWGSDFTDKSDGVFASEFFIATVIIACPCAMGLATPTAVMVGTGLGAKAGILIKSGEALEGAAKPKAVLFDKTGTLTLGKPSVTEFVWLKGGSDDDASLEEKVVKTVAAAEASSDHPIAKAIVAHCSSGPLSVPEDFVNIPGKGVTCTLEGSRLAIGKPKFIMEDEGVTLGAAVEEQVAGLQSEGKTVVVAAYKGAARCLFGISDVIREESRDVIAALHKRNVEVHLVTGDNARTAAHVAGLLGIPVDRVNSEILPAGKAMVVKALQEKLGKVFFVGDGINDTVALAQANVGIAIGGGTNVAVESADIVLIKDDLWGVPQSIQIAAATTRKIKWNFVWAFGYNVLAIPVAAGVFYPAFKLQLPPVIAGIAMVCSSLTVLGSSLLLKTFKPTRS